MQLRLSLHHQHWARRGFVVNLATTTIQLSTLLAWSAVSNLFLGPLYIGKDKVDEPTWIKTSGDTQSSASSTVVSQDVNRTDGPTRVSHVVHLFNLSFSYSCSSIITSSAECHSQMRSFSLWDISCVPFGFSDWSSTTTWKSRNSETPKLSASPHRNPRELRIVPTCMSVSTSTGSLTTSSI